MVVTTSSRINPTTHSQRRRGIKPPRGFGASGGLAVGVLASWSGTINLLLKASRSRHVVKRTFDSRGRSGLGTFCFISKGGPRMIALQMLTCGQAIMRVWQRLARTGLLIIVTR